MSLIARSRAFWRRPRAAAPMLALALGLMFVPGAVAAPTPLIVQGTTDIRDAGLLEDVIEPGFAAAYPQYELKYIAVGTGGRSPTRRPAKATRCWSTRRAKRSPWLKKDIRWNRAGARSSTPIT